MDFYEIEIKSVELVGGELHIVCKQDTGMATYKGPIINIWKDIYVAENGEIVKKQTVEGVYRPERYVEEGWSFPE